MKRLNSVLVLCSATAMTGALALGCGDSGGAKPDSSSKPASSSASNSGSAKPMANNSAKPTTSSAPGSSTGAPTMAAAGPAGDSIKFMPKTCDEGRIFVNLGKLLGGDVGKAAEGMQEKLVSSLASSGKPGDDKANKVLAALKDGGIEPIKAARELSVCAGKGDKAVVAVAMDFSGAKGKPADVFAKAMEASSGKAPKKEDEDGITYLTNDKNKVMAFVSPSVIVLGDSKEAIKPVAKGGDGAADFGDASTYVVWAKIIPSPNNPVDVTIKESGANYDLKALFAPPGADGAAFKKDPDGTIKKFNDEIAKIAPKLDKTPFKAATDAVKNAKLAKDGERMSLTTSFPQAMLAELAKAASSADPKDLMKGF